MNWGTRTIWSSTSYDTSYAWVLGFSNDYASFNPKTFSGYVRCVRGGQQNQAVIKPKPSTTSSSGTVIDRSTGLMWQKRPDGRKRKWKAAKRYCRNLTLAGYSDWELPSKNVLKDMRGKRICLTSTRWMTGIGRPRAA